jgi:hypothetical protein
MAEVKPLQGSYKYVYAPLMLTSYGISATTLLFHFTPRTNSDFNLYVVKTVLWNLEVTCCFVRKEIRKERLFIRGEFIRE